MVPVIDDTTRLSGIVKDDSSGMRPAKENHNALSPDSVDSRMSREYGFREGVLTGEEQRFFESDVLPLSFLQRGRFTATAFRGMPAGYFQFGFAGNHLSNPVTGVWNEQWLPYYRIDKRKRIWGGSGEEYEPYVPSKTTSLTQVVFSQDQQNELVDMSFLDIELYHHFSATNYIQLSGLSFLGRAWEDVNTFSGKADFKQSYYQVQLHTQLGEQWRADWFYWQLHHRFNLRPENEETFFADHFRQVGHLAWVRLQGKIGERDSLVMTPSFTIVDDIYRQNVQIFESRGGNYSLQGGEELRANEYYWAQINTQYFRKIGGIQLGSELFGRYLRNNGKHFWEKHKEQESRAALLLNVDQGPLELRLRGGYQQHQKSGQSVFGSGTIQLGKRQHIGLSAFFIPQAPPVLWRTIVHDSFPAYPETRFIEKQGASARLQAQLGNVFKLRLEPFAWQTRHFPVLIGDSLPSWQQADIKSYGGSVFTGFNLGWFQIQNDFTYQPNHKAIFAPKINNVSSVSASFLMFKKALRLESVFTWHYLEGVRIMAFDRLLHQYRLPIKSRDNFYRLGDFRIQAHFRNAVVFFIWQNTLPQAHSFIADSKESLRVFRLGIRWQFWN